MRKQLNWGNWGKQNDTLLKWSTRNDTMRNVILGVVTVIVVVPAVAFFMRKPDAPIPVPPVAAPVSTPAPQGRIDASAQESSEAAEASADAQSLAADSANPADETADSEPEPVGNTPVEEQPAPAVAPVPPPPAPVRKVKKVVAHRVRPAAAPSPAGAVAEVPAAPPEPAAPPAEPPLPALSIVIGVRRPQPGVLSKSVNLADLNLATPEGSCKAMRRIKRAAEDVCPFTDNVGLSMLYEHRKCVQETMDDTLNNLRRAKVELPSKPPGGC